MSQPSRFPQIAVSQPQGNAANSDAPVKNNAQPDAVTLPDDTSVNLKLETELSSAKAAVGDLVKFTVPYPVRIEGLVFIPKGTPVTGRVIEVHRPRRFGRDGGVKIAMNDLVLPTGETIHFRQNPKSEHHPTKVAGQLGQAVVESVPFFGVTLPMVAFVKGDDNVYPSGSWITVFVDGTPNLSRSALTKLEPPPYTGRPQIFVRNFRSDSVAVYAGEYFVGQLFPHKPILLTLKPGSYSIHAAKDAPVLIEAQQDHQYWLERQKAGLVGGDPIAHRDQMEEFETAPWVAHRDFTQEPPDYSGPPEIALVNRAGKGSLFCGKKKVLDLWYDPVRFTLQPGTYDFHTGKSDEKKVHLILNNDHVYWIERRREGLFLGDYQHLHNETDVFNSGVYLIQRSYRSGIKNICRPEASE